MSRQLRDKGVSSRWLPPATHANHAMAAPRTRPAAVMNPTTTALRRAFLMALVLDKVADASLGVRAGKRYPDRDDAEEVCPVFGKIAAVAPRGCPHGDPRRLGSTVAQVSRGSLLAAEQAVEVVGDDRLAGCRVRDACRRGRGRGQGGGCRCRQQGTQSD